MLVFGLVQKEERGERFDEESCSFCRIICEDETGHRRLRCFDLAPRAGLADD